MYNGGDSNVRHVRIDQESSVIEYDPPCAGFIYPIHLYTSAAKARNKHDPDKYPFGVIYSPGFWQHIVVEDKCFKIFRGVVR